MLLWGALTVVLCAAWGGPAAAQSSGEPDAATGSAAKPENDEGSQRVDESEENFRRRMELREQRFREQPRSNTTFSYSTSREGKLANLPPESQRHVREQLRDMVVESRLWEPGEDLTGYPYEPSAAAKHDAQLARQEREAFVEQLQKYQEREAAAAAADRTTGRAPVGEAGGEESGGPAQRRAERAGSAPVDGESGQGEGGPDPDAMSTAGVEESALEFLRERGLTEGGGSAGAMASLPDAPRPAQDAGSLPPTPAGDDAGAGENARATPPGTVDVSALAQFDSALSPSPSRTLGQGQSQVQSQAQGQPQSRTAAQAQSRAPSQPQAQSRSASPSRATSAQSADAAAQTESPAERTESDVEITMREVAEPVPEPGTLAVESLQRLDLDALRAGLPARPEREDDEP